MRAAEHWIGKRLFERIKRVLERQPSFAIPDG
jgi:hypothetical protein